jgi:hypothetical protein
MSSSRRFFAKVTLTLTGCWLWTGATTRGYGRFSLHGRLCLAHAVLAAWVGKQLPPGWEWDHLCRVRHCVRPSHLEAVPHRVNVLRGVAPTAINARKVACDAGHPLSGGNLYRDSRGARQCRVCRAESSRKWRRSRCLRTNARS